MVQPQPRRLSLHTPPSQEDARWKAFVARDTADGHAFLYGVRTTGIFCKPGCASRLPSRRNVLFFDTVAAAQAAGFRACLRCGPGQAVGTDPAACAVEAACRWMAQHPGEPVGTAALAARAGMSAGCLHRAFQRLLGVTPKRYATSLRMQHFKGELKRGASVTDGVYASGFGSTSRLYEKTDTLLGMAPGVYRAGGVGMQMSYASLHTSLGPMLLAATDRGICFLQFGHDADGLLAALHREFPRAVIDRMTDEARPEFDRWAASIQHLVDGVAQVNGLPLDLRATAFQLRVWDYLQTIPAGEPRSYAQAAAELGMPRSTRAVASACARNRVAVLVPCHRVLRGDGTLGGYRWGLERKGALLEREAVMRGSQTPASPSTP